jgi:hypothetical protein
MFMNCTPNWKVSKHHITIIGENELYRGIKNASMQKLHAAVPLIFVLCTLNIPLDLLY